MKNSDLRKLSDEELTKKIADNKKDLLDLRLKQAQGSLERPSAMRELKKDVARMLTILRERQLSQGKEDE